MLSQRALEAFHAASTLSVSQPAVSRHLRDLESRTGLVLFTRMGNRSVPADAARALLLEVERSFVGLSAIEATPVL